MADNRGVFSLRIVYITKKLDQWTALTDVWTTLSPLSVPNTGYFGGGNPGPFSTMDKVTYSTDTRSTVPNAALSAARTYLGASSARANALPTIAAPSSSEARFADNLFAGPNTGYFGGGATPNYSTMDKVSYSTDVTGVVPGAALSVARRYIGATGSLTAGYFGGGSAFPAFYSTMDKVTYSSDTRSTVPGAALSTVLLS